MVSTDNGYTYRTSRTRNSIVAYAEVKQAPLAAKGAYTMDVWAATKSGRPLGAKQQQIANDLRLEARGALTAELYAAGWHSQSVTTHGRTVVLWLPPVEA